MGDQEYIFRAENLHKSYGKYKALNGLYMNVPRGSIYGFVGKNGAGKTTLLRLLCGLQRPTSGQYRLNGIMNTDQTVTQMRRKMGSIVESPALYKDMNAVENMRQQYRLLKINSFEKIPEILRLVGLEETERKKVQNFSMGMRQKLGIAMALSGTPEFLILDEPINGLDPQGILELRQLILKLNREKKVTVLISSHILEELSKLATHYGFIDHGKMIKEMTAEELEQDCPKTMVLEVTDRRAMEQVFAKEHVEYQVLSETQVRVFSSRYISQLAFLLQQADCEIISCWKEEEKLEKYVINMLGGKENDSGTSGGCLSNVL